MIMGGMDARRSRRLPRRGMRISERRVNKKFVIETVRDVNVGSWKPSCEKMVAEKYINAF